MHHPKPAPLLADEARSALVSATSLYFVLFSADAQNQLATAQEKERASTERSIELSSRVASLESHVANYRQEKSRIEAEFELEKAKLEALEDYKSR
jgi:uncharacterized protein YceH (UPF0502 family)